MGHEFSDDDDRRTAVREIVELGAREAIMTLRTAASRWSARAASGAYRVPRSSRSSRCRRWARGTPSWPASWRRATASGTARSACASPWPAAPSPPSTSGPAVEQREVERLMPEVRVEELETPAVGVRLGPPGVGRAPAATVSSPSAAEPRIPPWKLRSGEARRAAAHMASMTSRSCRRRRTRDPDDIDISWTLGPYRFELPLLASAMDGVVSPETAGDHRRARRPRRAQPRGHLHPLRGRRGAARAHRWQPKESPRREMQRIYAEPVKEELIGRSASARSRTRAWSRRLAHAAARARATTRRRSRPGSTSW